MFLTSLRAAIARVFWWLSPWKLVREAVPVDGPRLLIGAPHTSNFDFVLMLGIAWDARMRIHWLGKRELFKGIAGPIMRLPEEKLHELAPLMLEAAAEMTQASLGSPLLNRALHSVRNAAGMPR